MRHRKRGRKLGRNPNHQRALLRNLASGLILTERDSEGDENTPKVKGRIITTLAKAKEVRPLVEKCITIARRSLPHQEAADQLGPKSERHTEKWRAWRESPTWYEWNRAIAPVVAARRRALQLLGDKQAVRVLFDEIAPRYVDRPGGYTRVLQLAQPRLGDAARRAIIEFVGTHDRVQRRAERPAFEIEKEFEEAVETPQPAATEEPAATGPGEEPAQQAQGDVPETAEAPPADTAEGEQAAGDERNR